MQGVAIKDYMVLNIFTGAAAAESALHRPWSAGLYSRFTSAQVKQKGGKGLILFIFIDMNR
jgi:hypothetical protein